MDCMDIPYGLTARIAGFHPAGPGSTPGMGNILNLVRTYGLGEI